MDLLFAFASDDELITCHCPSGLENTINVSINYSKTFSSRPPQNQHHASLLIWFSFARCNRMETFYFCLINLQTIFKCFRDYQGGFFAMWDGPFYALLHQQCFGLRTLPWCHLCLFCLLFILESWTLNLTEVSKVLQMFWVIFWCATGVILVGLLCLQITTVLCFHYFWIMAFTVGAPNSKKWLCNHFQTNICQWFCFPWISMNFSWISSLQRLVF